MSRRDATQPTKATAVQLAAAKVANARQLTVLWSGAGDLHVSRWFQLPGGDSSHSFTIIVDRRGGLFTMLDGHTPPTEWRAAWDEACSLHHALRQAVKDAEVMT
ncbi:MAG: hypothetical protein DI536_29010 [Archangium gephyra]|uniref:Uncharacterized protein n=1 Tax=Archangium gephyra TaxID=48 RepID=A0A2W5SUW6_9BACT|nr:MAG: hypothetical protein DI536_29010 [Archangium gephyra]